MIIFKAEYRENKTAENNVSYHATKMAAVKEIREWAAELGRTSQGPWPESVALVHEINARITRASLLSLLNTGILEAQGRIVWTPPEPKKFEPMEVKL